MRAKITGERAGQKYSYCATMVHDNTAIAAAAGTGSIAQLVLAGKLNQPGIYPVEQALPTDMFIEAMNSRNIKIVSS